MASWTMIIFNFCLIWWLLQGQSWNIVNIYHEEKPCSIFLQTRYKYPKTGLRKKALKSYRKAPSFVISELGCSMKVDHSDSISNIVPWFRIHHQSNSRVVPDDFHPLIFQKYRKSNYIIPKIFLRIIFFVN